MYRTVPYGTVKNKYRIDVLFVLSTAVIFLYVPYRSVTYRTERCQHINVVVESRRNPTIKDNLWNIMRDSRKNIQQD